MDKVGLSENMNFSWMSSGGPCTETDWRTHLLQNVWSQHLRICTADFKFCCSCNFTVFAIKRECLDHSKVALLEESDPCFSCFHPKVAPYHCNDVFWQLYIFHLSWCLHLGLLLSQYGQWGVGATEDATEVLLTQAIVLRGTRWRVDLVRFCNPGEIWGTGLDYEALIPRNVKCKAMIVMS